MQRCQFVSGSWEALSLTLEKTEQPKFDIILMSETLYNTNYYTSLVSLIDQALDTSSSAAAVVIGTKTFYYGLGGGFFQFQMYLEEQSHLRQQYRLETYAKFNDMKSIERMILLMKRGLASQPTGPAE